MSIQSTADLPAPAIATPARTQRKSDLTVGVATELNEIVEAWRLVYDLYRRIEIIDENPVGLHTNLHAVAPDTSVIVGQLDGEAVSTLTIMQDGPYGLPLDSVYNRQLNLLRRLGRPILEVGLLADRREKAGRAMAAIMEMMRYAFWNAALNGADLLCGVHPHHAQFYIRTFGFDTIGPVTVYPTVRNQPVVLLRLDIPGQMRCNPLPRGVDMYLRNPLSSDAFDQRYPLEPRRVTSTPIARYLRHRGVLDETGRVTSPIPSFVWRRNDEGSIAA